MTGCPKGMLVAITQDWGLSFVHSLLLALYGTLLLLCAPGAWLATCNTSQ